MLNAVMTRTVAFCTRHAWGVILFAVILAAFGTSVFDLYQRQQSDLS